MKNKTQIADTAAFGGTFQIENIVPLIDGGRFPVKRIAGEPIELWADVYRDAHDVIAASILWRAAADENWNHAPLVLAENDRWYGHFTPQRPGRYVIAIEAWTDEFATWRHGLELKMKAGQDVNLDALEGVGLLAKALDGDRISSAVIVRYRDAFLSTGEIAPLLDAELQAAMARAQPRPDLTRTAHIPLTIDRDRARNGAWYEMMPRSQSSVPGQHGTFRDCIARLPDVAAMGFDVLYFTPINPIGVKNRKGRNNTLTSAPGDPGSPYAIGGAAGGHDAIHPELGTLQDFHALVKACESHGLEIALDVAVQCSLDHPWLTEHPDWFKRRPDGTMKYAENPPKRYEDIVNPNFDCTDAAALWRALRNVILYWVDQGVKIFRIDNPHTKPLPFWEWLIEEVQRDHPDVIFLAEAFTRPKLMKGLAKLGFSQSYTYFTWRTEKWEIEQYLNELAGYPEREFYRPNFFVNTPDILPFHLQSGEAWMFKSRLALAAILSSTYGVYSGFELLEHEPIPGKEEYLNSEKYEIRQRDWNGPGNIKDYITAINFARRANPALQQTSNLRFLAVDNPNVIGFVKESVDRSNLVAGAISLSRDPSEFWLPINSQILVDGHTRDVLAVENLITGERHGVEWGGLNVRLDPLRDPAVLFRCLV